jgi:hypothetical protein
MFKKLMVLFVALGLTPSLIRADLIHIPNNDVGIKLSSGAAGGFDVSQGSTTVKAKAPVDGITDPMVTKPTKQPTDAGHPNMGTGDHIPGTSGTSGQ